MQSCDIGLTLLVLFGPLADDVGFPPVLIYVIQPIYGNSKSLAMNHGVQYEYQDCELGRQGGRRKHGSKVSKIRGRTMTRVFDMDLKFGNVKFALQSAI